MGVWVEAARPRTLPAAVAPVVVGTALAQRTLLGRALLALVVALALQVAVNYANDYFDGVRGIDTDDRVGPRRVTAAGLVAPAEMRRAIVVALGVAVLAGGVLALLVGWELLLVGAAAVLAAVGYSGGRRPYASLGLGEVAVFVFFGLVATVGSTYVQDETVGLGSVVAGCAMGALATALLVVNNLRDIPTDEAAGKRTLPVRLGVERTRDLYVGLVLGALVLLLPLAAVTGSGWVLGGLLALPVLAPGLQLVRNAPVGPRLVLALEATARGQLAFALLVTAGLLLDRSLA